MSLLKDLGDISSLLGGEFKACHLLICCLLRHDHFVPGAHKTHKSEVHNLFGQGPQRIIIFSALKDRRQNCNLYKKLKTKLI